MADRLSKREWNLLTSALALYDAEHEDEPAVVTATDSLLRKIRRAMGNGSRVDVPSPCPHGFPGEGHDCCRAADEIASR
jgi:hypothetical protein